MWLQELSKDNAHTLFDGKADGTNLKDFVSKETQGIDTKESKEQREKTIKELKTLKNDILGSVWEYPDFIKTLAQQKRKATTKNKLWGIPPEIAKIWNDPKNPKAPNALLTKIEEYMQTDDFKKDCIKDFLGYMAPSITDFVYLVKGIGKDSLCRLDELSWKPWLADSLIKKLATPASLQNLALRKDTEPHATIMKWLKGDIKQKSTAAETSSTQASSWTTDATKNPETTKKEPSFNDKIKQWLAAMYRPKIGSIPYLDPKHSEKVKIDATNNIVRLLITDPNQHNAPITISPKLDENSKKFGSIPAQYVIVGKEKYVWTGEKFVRYFEENEKQAFTRLDAYTKKNSWLQQKNLSEKWWYAWFKTQDVIDRWKQQEIKNHNDPLEKIDNIWQSRSLSQTTIIPTTWWTASDTVKKVGKESSYWTDPDLRGVSSLGIGIDITKETKTYNPITIDGKIYTPVEVEVRHIASNQKINENNTQKITLLMAPNGDILQWQNLRGQKDKIQQEGWDQAQSSNPTQRALSEANLKNYGQIPISRNEFYALAQNSDGKTLSRQSFKT